MSQPNSHFHYFPIDTGNQEIRLIVIEPDEPDERLSCALICTSLQDAPIYKALSYTWGSSGAARPVNIDGQTFFIRRNLEQAMRRFRHTEEEVYIWADAICINQADLDERSKHIIYVHTVYEHADEVLVWLGDAADDSELVANKLNHLETQAASLEDFGEALSNITEVRFLEAISKLFARPWWSRVWTIQEFVWARQITFFCGSALIRMESLATINAYLHSFQDTYPSPSQNQLGDLLASQSLIFLYACRSTPPETLLGNLVPTRLRSSTDPRDKVFALLNLIPREEWPMQPDYTKSTVEVFSAVAQYLIRRSKNLKTLELCEPPIFPVRQDHLRIELQLQNTLGLPSWVPDWASFPQTVSFLPELEDVLQVENNTGDHMKTFRPYAAGGNAAASFQFSTNGLSLTVDGVFYDTIDDICPPNFRSEVETRNILHQKRFYTFLESWMSRKVTPDHCKHFEVDKVIFRTLAGSINLGDHASMSKDMQRFTD